MSADRGVQTTLLQYQETGQITLYYNAIQLVNNGTSNAKINNVLTLPPGGVIGWAHNANEINKQPVTIDFPDGDGGLVNAIVLTYTDVKQPLSQ
jgi:hypothetical protein